MKRIAVGALFLSLVAGSAAMAGQGFGHVPRDRDERSAQNNQAAHPSFAANRGDGRRDDDRHGGRQDNRDNDHRNWQNDRRGDGRNDHRNWQNDRRGDGRDDHRNWQNDRRGDWRDDHRNWQNDRRGDWRDNGRRNYREPYRNDWRSPHYNYGAYRHPWGYYDHRWTRGERLPSAFYARPYVIANYRDCGLDAPPYGYHWVRVNNDAVLAFIATGVVLDVLYNQFY